MSKVFVIADTHFNHANIIKYCNRPFKDADEMNREIIARWNSVVHKEDIVFHLGDVGLGNRNDLYDIIPQLNGHKKLIIGNHDTWKPDQYRLVGFDEVYKYPIIYKDFFIFSHYPQQMPNNIPYANIYGHVHDDKNYKDYTENTFCVSAERIDYTPILLDECVKKMESVNGIS